MQSKITTFMVSDKVTITMTKGLFKTGIVKMVVEEATPFHFFSQEAFKSLNGELAGKHKETLPIKT